MERVEIPMPFTPREHKILSLVASGCTNPVIAERLVVVLKTVEFHVHNILGKTGAKNRFEAVEYARSRGFLPPSEWDSNILWSE